MAECPEPGFEQAVSYADLVQVELTTSLATIAQITADRIALQVTIIVCNFDPLPVGYDLKMRPSADSTANKHFERGSSTSGLLKLEGGNTEFWELIVRPGESWIIEAKADSNNDIAMTISTADIGTVEVLDLCA